MSFFFRYWREHLDARMQKKQVITEAKHIQNSPNGVRYSLVVLLALPKREDPGSIPGIALDRQAGNYSKTLQLRVTS